MPAAIAFECEVSEASIADFVKALAEFQRKTQRNAREALRSCVIDLVKSLRAQTRKSPKVVPRSDVRFGETAPKYITGDKGSFRRVVISRWAKGQRVQKVHWQMVGTKYRSRRTRSGGISETWAEDKAGMLREARQRYGKIRQWGLAKKSWGWLMKSFFQQSAQDENPAAVVKPGVVDGGMREFHAVLPDGRVDRSAPFRCDVDIVNRLSYIKRALAPGALPLAVEKARRKILWKAGSRRNS